jgi:predicted outer membrane repeat protein
VRQRDANRFRPALEHCEDRTTPTPVVTVSSSMFPTTSEGSFSPAQFTLSRTDSTMMPLTVNVSLGGTATGGGTDYTASGISGGTVTFQPGSSTATVNVTAVTDGVYDPDETVTLTVDPGSGYDPGSPDSAQVTITDTLPTITVTALSSTIGEGGSIAYIYFNRSGDLSQALTVNYEAGGTATGGGTDYTLYAGATISFSAWQSMATVQVAINDDGLSELTEAITLTATSGTGYRVGSPAGATVSILDNDVQYVSVEKIDDATEGGTGKFRFTRTGDISSALSNVNFSLTGSTASSGTDYTSIGSTVNFAANQQSVDVNVVTLEDDLLEGREAVTVTVASGTGYTPTGSPADLTIIDKVYGETFDWNGVATVEVLVTYDAPGHDDEFLWNYHVTNDSFSSGIANFALPLEDVGMISDSGGSSGWSDSVGTDLITWSNGTLLTLGNSADLWFTTAPTGLGFTSGFVTDAGVTASPGGLLITAMAAAPAPPLAPPPGFLVTTGNDVLDDFDREFSLREAVIFVNGLTKHPDNLPRVAFTNGLSGATSTLDPARGKLTLDNDIFIDGPVGGITIQRNSGAAQKHRIFELNEGYYAKLADLTLKNGKVDNEAGGAILSNGQLVVENCTFVQNEATGSRGGAIAAVKGQLSVSGSGFTGNTARLGGAIFIDVRVSTSISTSSITLNTATENGAASTSTPRQPAIRRSSPCRGWT